MAPAVASERPKRSNSHSASSDWTTKPPAKASRLNRAASVRRCGASGRAAAGVDQERRLAIPRQAAVEQQREPAQRGVDEERGLEAGSAPHRRGRRRLGQGRAERADRGHDRADEAVAGEERGAVLVARQARELRLLERQEDADVARRRVQGADEGRGAGPEVVEAAKATPVSTISRAAPISRVRPEARWA